MSTIKISHPTGEIKGEVTLDGSKSISNRVLIIRALSDTHFDIDHLSTSDDTKTLSNLLERIPDGNIYNVGHAGTTFRFLTAYLSLQEGTQTLTGSPRMLERPIGPLVDALRSLGCDIDYKGREGYPPLEIRPVDKATLKSEVEIDAGISSQYITALMLIAPTLPNGLTIKLKGDMVSESYLQLTQGILNDFGIKVSLKKNVIDIRPQAYQPRSYRIEADWSAASYYFSIVALAKKASITLKGLFENSLQGDAQMIEVGDYLGVQSNWADKWDLSKKSQAESLVFDFINQPDTAQTVAVMCAAQSILNSFSGLKTLRIKETDRIDAVDIELKKINSSFQLERTDEQGEEHYTISPGVSFNSDIIPTFETYKDHRMAMAFAPLALLHPIYMNKPEVVTKSYPEFWKDLESLGFVIEQVEV